MSGRTEATPGRTSGRSVVLWLGVGGAVLFAFALVLALRLTPAAERWRGDFPTAKG